MYRPLTLATDSSGSVYVSDSMMYRVRKIAPDGTISTFAGTGRISNAGDGHAAASASVYPGGVAVAADGAVLIASGCSIRRVDRTGVISTFAGTSGCGFLDDGVPAKAMFSTLAGLAFDRAGNLFVADIGNQRVRKIAADGTVSTVAGNGNAGVPIDGPAIASPLNGPSDVAVDSGGNVYIADRYNSCIRKVAPDGSISTVAGGPSNHAYGGDGGLALSAGLGYLQAVKVDAAGAIWLADPVNHVVRRIGPDGIVTTVAGNGSAGPAADGPGWATQLFAPSGLAVAPEGIYVAESGSGRVRLLARPKRVQ